MKLLLHREKWLIGQTALSTFAIRTCRSTNPKLQQSLIFPIAQRTMQLIGAYSKIESKLTKPFVI